MNFKLFLLTLLNPILMIGLLWRFRHSRITRPKLVPIILLSVSILSPVWAIPTIKIDSPADKSLVETDVTQVTVQGTATAVGGGDGIDLMLVLDDSGSLGDVAYYSGLEPSDPDKKRFDAVRGLLASFASNPNVRTGLVFFTDVAPLTVPISVLSTAIPSINAELNARQEKEPVGGTAIGAGINTAANELSTNGRPEASRVILLFTDGENYSGPNPVNVARQAKDQGIIVNVLGLGGGATSETNQQIAETGGGIFLSTTDPAQLAASFSSSNIVGIKTVNVTNKTTNQVAQINISAGVFNASVNLVRGENVIEVAAIDLNDVSRSESITVIRKQQFGISLVPENVTQAAGTNHTVTATVIDADSNRVQGSVITFEVTQGPNAGSTGNVTTNANGEAAFTYSVSACAGTDQIQARLVESLQNETFFSNIVSGTTPPLAPTARFTAIYESKLNFAPVTVALDGSSSTPYCGVESIASYQWQSSDGQTIAPGANSSITYTQPGDYEITLAVTDNLGATATSSPQTLTVLPLPSNLEALRIYLEGLDGVDAVNIDGNAVSVIMLAQIHQGVLNGEVTQGPPPNEFVVFTGIADANGDGIDDFEVTYPSGDQQTLFYLGTTNTNSPPSIAATDFSSVVSTSESIVGGANPAQTGVVPGTIDPMNAAILRGKVIARNGGPLSGVTVSITNHPEFGQTLTDALGQFNLAVNGGNSLTLNYQKADYLPVQRPVQLTAQDDIRVDDVVMTPFSVQVTTVELGDDVPPIQVVQSDVETDKDGSRQATLLFEPGVSATMTLPNGTTQALDELTIRATEYTVGENGLEAMPGLLPSTADYTYAIDLSVDQARAAGATQVNLSRAIPIYVDNFLDFPVGTIVPSGYYDREQSNWVAAENGRVVQVLGVDQNGLAQLDIDGSGQAANAQALAELGLTDAERQQLAIQSADGTPKSYMRVFITQITPYDLNWDIADATDPSLPPGEGGSEHPPEDSNCAKGCIIEVQSQVLGERIPVVGTPFTLNYRSSRVPGYTNSYRLVIRLRNELTPANVKRIELQTSIAGKTLKETFPASTAQTTLTWDGKDAYGRHLQGRQKGDLRICYVYDGVYQVPTDIERTFGVGGSGVSLGIPARREVRGCQEYTKLFGAWYTKGLGGFTLSVHHSYDPNDQVLYRGDGGQRQVAATTLTDSDELFGTQWIVASEGGGLVYEFSLNGRHLRTLDSLTGQAIYTFLYDDNGYLVGVRDIDGDLTTIERNGETPVAIVAPDGQRTTLSVDQPGYLTAIANPAGETHQFVYDPTGNGLLTQHTNPRGQVATYIYEAGKLVQDVDPVGGGWQLARSSNPEGYTTTLTSGEGRVSRFKVGTLADGTSQRITIAPDGTSIQSIEDKAPGETFTLNSTGTLTILKEGPDPRFGKQSQIPQSLMVITPNGLTSTVTTEKSVTLAEPNNPLSLTALLDKVTVNGRTSTSYYDATTRTITATSPQGRQIVIFLDDKGRIVREQVPGLADVGYQYDDRGRLAVIAEGWKAQDNGASARITSLGYGADNGYLKTITDALGRQIDLFYDPAGRVVTIRLPDGREMSYGYDANNNLTVITPPERPAHRFDYTAVDLQAQYTPPTIGLPTPQTQYQYNLDKQLTKIVRPDSQVIDFIYNQDTGRLDRLSLPHGQQDYAYSSTGNLDTMTAPDGSTLSYGYDGFLPLFERWGNGPINGTVAHYYDANFRVTATLVNTDHQITYQYEADGLLIRAGGLWLGYDPKNGLLIDTVLGEVKTHRTHNGFGEVATETATFADNPRYTIDYRRDKLGRITQKEETIEGVTTTYGYQYDVAGRLEAVSENGVFTDKLAYDGNGNRVGYDSTARGYVAGRVDEQDRLIQYGANHYTYSDNGELLTKQNGEAVTQYEYDVLGNLRSVQLPDGKRVEYVIDARNRRVGKKVNGVLTQGFLYEGSLNQVAELDGHGHVVSLFVYGSKINVPNYMIKQGITYRILSDHLGSPRLIINVNDGTVAQRMDYDVFGNVIQDSNPGFQPFGFAGGIYDVDTGLVRFGARDYDPETGRWTAKDPILFAGGDSNLYGYVSNDPVNFLDTEGTKSSLIQNCKENVNRFIKWIGSAVAIKGSQQCINDADKSGEIIMNCFDAMDKLPINMVPKKCFNHPAVEAFKICVGAGAKVNGLISGPKPIR